MLVLRAVAIYALANPPRAVFEQMLMRSSPDQRQAAPELAAEQQEKFWAQLGLLRQALSPREQEFAATDMVTMTDRQQTAAAWRTEALQTLLWAVGVAPEILPYDVPATDAPLKQFRGDDLDKALASSKLRPSDELERARSIAELWHWRARTRQLVERGETPTQTPQTVAAGIRTFDDIVRASAKMAAKKGMIPTTIDDDFPLCGKPYRDAPDHEFSLAQSIAMERHFALNWLCGFAPGGRWDETPTDT